MKRQTRDGNPQLEIQIHPSDIRKGVRYLFLSRKQILLCILGLLVFVGYLGVGFWIAPTTVRTLWSQREYRKLLDTREKLGERVTALSGRLEELEAESERMRLRIGKIKWSYGLFEDLSIGQGGYPGESRTVPESIYSDQIAHAAKLEARLLEELNVLGAFLQEIQAFEEAHEEQVRYTPAICPLRGDFVLTSPLGNRKDPFTKKTVFHNGIDLAAPEGTPIHAPADGKVVFAGRVPLRQSVAWWNYGNLITIRHGERFLTFFGHCEEIRVRAGKNVKQGEVIGTVGNTGWSTNPHLHYEVRVLGDGEDADYYPVDPRIYILDHRWRDEERLLVRARRARPMKDFEPLPRLIAR